jgi:trans-aconitate 2-methyltransferase
MTEWNAAEYARVSELQKVMAEEALALLDLKGTERVLDVGCGNGRFTAEIAARVPFGSVLGIDPSAAMIAFAVSHFGPALRSNLRFEAADARRLNFRDEFDLVVSFNALHWVPEQGEALGSIRSALKPDGVAQLRLVPAGERKSLENVIEETRLSSRWARYFRTFHDPYLHLTPEKYGALAERSGLHVRRGRNQPASTNRRLGSASGALQLREVREAEDCGHVHLVVEQLEQTFLIRTDAVQHHRAIGSTAFAVRFPGMARSIATDGADLLQRSGRFIEAVLALDHERMGEREVSVQNDLLVRIELDDEIDDLARFIDVIDGGHEILQITQRQPADVVVVEKDRGL